MQGIYVMDPPGTEYVDELLESEELEDSESSVEKNSDDNGSEDLDDGDERDQEAKDDATEDVDAEIRTHEEAPAKIVRKPADPTPEEKARHDATHLPYRPRCPICVEARATEDQHYKRTAEERHEGLPQICIDYFEIGEDEDDKTDKQTCPVARDKWSQAMFAMVFEVKGDDDKESARGLRRFITSTG